MIRVEGEDRDRLGAARGRESSLYHPLGVAKYGDRGPLGSGKLVAYSRENIRDEGGESGRVEETVSPIGQRIGSFSDE